MGDDGRKDRSGFIELGNNNVRYFTRKIGVDEYDEYGFLSNGSTYFIRTLKGDEFRLLKGRMGERGAETNFFRVDKK